MDGDHGRVELFGGNPFLRSDLPEILAGIPTGQDIVLWSPCVAVPELAGPADAVSSRRIRAVKVQVPLPGAAAGGWESPGELDRRLRRLSRLGVALHLYLPAGLDAVMLRSVSANLHHWSVTRVYTCLPCREPAKGTAAVVSCGMALQQVRLAWAAGK
jgi:hypothetical protein